MEQYLAKIEQFQDKLMYMGYWDILVNNWNKIMAAVMAAVLVFAILNCFWGYQMMRLWMSLIALAVGGLVGGYFALQAFDSRNKIFLTAVVCGMAVAMLANLIYRVGLIVLCAGMVFLTFELLFPVASMGVHTGFVALGIVAGIAAFEYEDLVVTWVTGICGGLVSARIIFLFLKLDHAFYAIALGAVIAALGIRFQYGKLRRDPDVEARQKKLRQKRGE